MGTEVAHSNTAVEETVLEPTAENLEGIDQTRPADDCLAEFVATLSAQAALDMYETNLRSAWNAVKGKNLIICSDLFDKIDKEDIIEIWDLTGKQLFRSFHALRYFSYTIEELNMYPFYELFERDISVEAAYAEEFVRIMKGELTGTYKLPIPAHVVREKRAARGNVSLVTPKYVSPLKDRFGRVVAFIYTCSARKIID